MSNRSKRKSRGGSNANASTAGSSGGGAFKKGRSAATRIDFAAPVDDSGDESDTNRRRKDDRYDDDLYSDDESSGQEMSGGRLMKGGGSDDDEESTDEEERETVDAKKIRLARQYLDKMERRVAAGGGSAGAMGDDLDSDGGSSSDEELSDEYGGGGGARTMAPSPHDKLGAALARQRRKKEGTLERRLATKTRKSISCLWEGRTCSSSGPIADFASFVKDGAVTLHRGHDLTPTAVALHRPSGSTAYSGSKDNSVCMWDVERGVKTATLCPQFKKSRSRSRPRRPRNHLATKVVATKLVRRRRNIVPMGRFWLWLRVTMGDTLPLDIAMPPSKYMTFEWQVKELPVGAQ